MKAGFIALAGRPSVGKSTLLNSLVNANVAITSDKPETTRKAIRGILTNLRSSDNANLPYPELDDFQIVFVDTPGIHRPRTLLGERLNQITTEQLTNVDIILFLLPANEKIGPGDKYIYEQLSQIKSSRIKIFAIITKSDLVKPAILAEKLIEVSRMDIFSEIIPVSGKTDHGVAELVKVSLDYLEIGDLLYAADELTDESWQSMVSEIVREVALDNLKNELPHSLMVQINEREGDIIYVNLFVERDSQKGIIIGKSGNNIKQIRQTATKRVREILGDNISLNLQVKIAKDWQKNPKLLAKFGF